MRYLDKPKDFVRGTKQSTKISTETYELSMRYRHGQASCSSTQSGEEYGVYWRSIGGVRPVPQAIPLTPGFDNEWGGGEPCENNRPYRPSHSVSF